MEYSYPRDVKPEEVFTQETLDRLTTSLFTWQQGPGHLGGLHLHSCWGTTSVLTRRYHGQSLYMAMGLLEGARRLFAATGGLRWKRLADDVVSNILFMQARNGGFIHAVGESEPAYWPEVTCTVHQFLPIITLLEYAEWEHADPTLKALIRPAIDRHWEWSLGLLWRSGCPPYLPPPLEFPGWCGVANQDLTAITSLALYGKVYGDWGRFEEYGQPSLEVYTSPRYYFPQIGLLARVAAKDYVEIEPIVYHAEILAMLARLRACAGEPRLLEMMDNISRRLFDALFVWEDGHLHLSWRAKVSLDDKSCVQEWLRTPLTLEGYPILLTYLRRYLAGSPEETKAAQLAALERTLASYVFADGTIPIALGAKDPIFSIVTSPASGSLNLWTFLLERLGDKICDPAYRPTACLQRHRGNLTWKSNERMWAIEQDGRRRFAGLKAEVGAFVVGPEETVVTSWGPKVDFGELNRADITETVAF